MYNSKLKFGYFTIFDSYTYWCDLLITPNIYSLKQSYNKAQHTKHLEGPQYFVFSKKIREYEFEVRKNNPPNLLVNFGGADPHNITNRILPVLKKVSPHFGQINVVVGGLNQQAKNIMNQAWGSIKVHHNTTKMFELMSKTDVGFLACGLTFWELSTFGVPSFIIPSSKRELAYGDYIAENKYATKLGDYSKPLDLLKIENALLEYVDENEVFL